MSRTKGKRLSISSFVTKILNILEDKDFRDIVDWNQTQDGFKIMNIHQFTEKVLPKYFKHQNLSSFVRQLNMYGFNKIRTSELITVYQNPFFKKGNRSSLKKIERKSTNFEDKVQVVSVPSKIRKQELKPGNQVGSLRERQILLEEKFKELMKNNANLFNNNLTMITNVKKQDKRQQRLMSQVYKMFNIKAQDNRNMRIQDQVAQPGSESLNMPQESANKNAMEVSTLSDNGEPLNLSDFIDLDEFEELIGLSNAHQHISE